MSPITMPGLRCPRCLQFNQFHTRHHIYLSSDTNLTYCTDPEKQFGGKIGISELSLFPPLARYP